MDKILHLFDCSGGCPAKKTSKLEIFCNQIIDSMTVGGIAGFSAYVAAGSDASFKVFGLAFGLTFLIKFKEYRGIK